MSRLKPFGKRSVSIIYGKRRARKTFFGSDLNFMGVRFFLPRTLYSLLMAFRAAKGIPIARLVAIAIHNEMMRDDAFKLKIAADTRFIPGKYTNEAAIIYRFLNDNKGGMAKDLLIMSRKHIGVMDEEGFLHGITELVETGLVEEVFNIEGSEMSWVQIKNFKETEDYEIKRTITR